MSTCGSSGLNFPWKSLTGKNMLKFVSFDASDDHTKDSSAHDYHKANFA